VGRVNCCPAIRAMPYIWLLLDFVMIAYLTCEFAAVYAILLDLCCVLDV
jgi:hypothetical protein